MKIRIILFFAVTLALSQTYIPQSSLESKKNKPKNDAPQVVPSQISKGTFYYVEERKYSKDQEKEWKRRCRRKYKLQDEYKDCYQKLKKEYIESLE